MVRRGYASDTDEGTDDERLQRLITDRIDSDSAFWMGAESRSTMIVVEVDEGYGTLSGSVRSAVERRRADIIARALGAVGVDNRLRLDEEIVASSA